MICRKEIIIYYENIIEERNEILTGIKSFGKLGKFVECKKKFFFLLFISKCIYNIFIQYIDTNL